MAKPPRYDLALALAQIEPQRGALGVGEEFPLRVIVKNQGSVDANDFSVVLYLPPHLAVSDTDWVQLDKVGAVHTVSAADLRPTGQLELDVRVRAVAPAVDSELAVLWAEIAEDDGEDTDSSPDFDPSNDNRPTAVDGPTNNAFDGREGDEDDHDIAGVMVATGAG